MNQFSFQALCEMLEQNIYHTNPLYRGFINVRRPERVFTFVAPKLGKRIIVSSEVTKVLIFACQNRSWEELAEYVLKSCLSHSRSIDIANALLEKLMGHQLIIESNKLPKDTIWDKYNWREADYFNLETMNTEFIEDLQNVDTKLILEEYLIRNPLKENFYTKSFEGERKISLPEISTPDGNLVDAFKWRRTIRDFTGVAIDWDICANILQYATRRSRSTRDSFQINMNNEAERLMDSLFSPFEVYLITFRVNGIEAGLYHYNQGTNTINLVKKGEFQDILHRSIIGQRMGKNNAFAIVITSVFYRYQWRYRNERGYRNLLITLGELAQMFVVAASAFRVRHWMTPALLDSEIDGFLGLDVSEEQSMYVLGFGG